jgi:hypothetical protein
MSTANEAARQEVDTARAEPHSEGLRMYRERCSDLFPDSVRGRTWYDQRDWVQDNVQQQSLVEVFVQLMKDLTPISQAVDGTPEGRLADEIRDVADVVWYALDEASSSRADELVASLDDFQPAGGTDMSTR